MTKLLSIIIPTYNMAALLPRCLNSLVSAQHADEVEAIVVNDGSKDNSLEVARDYESRFPNTVTVIDKPNGNYGSTINAALPVAQGKYVKVLDSDDWFDTAALDKFLDSIRTVDVDMAITHFSQIGHSVTEVIRYNTMGREPYTYGKIYHLDNILPDGYIRFFLMHAITYRTQMLRDMGYRQTEGISYTDTEWANFPVYKADTIVFFDINLYQYNLDREGQTMDPSILLKSIPQILKISDSLINYYETNHQDVSPMKQAFLKKYMEDRYRLMYKVFLLNVPRKDFDASYFTEVERKLCMECNRNGLNPKLYPENKILRVDYIQYWRKHHKRWPVWFEKFNHLVDVIAKWFYVKLFRR